MRISQVLFAVVVVFGLQSKVSGQDSGTIFSLYLVRHAEKELSADNPKDPPLTECGEQRAESLAAFLSSVDLEAIYSSDYLRTRNTAEPAARQKELELQIYDPKKLDDFSELLLKRKQDALIVGHSNSTPALAGLLLGQKLESMDESIHDRIYQIIIYKDKGRLQLLHSSFVCNLEEVE